MALNKWAGVQVAVESARVAALPISGITKASPGVVSYSSGTDPTNGDYLVHTIQGMRQLDARVLRAANVNGAGNTYELEGLNTTSFDTFTSGTAEVVTLGTTLSIVRGTSSSGGDFNFIDATTIHDLNQRQIPGVANAAVFNLELNWDPSDAGFAALVAASNAQLPKVIRFTFATGAKVVFLGYVGASGLPGGNAGELVTSPAVITMFGSPTYYAT